MVNLDSLKKNDQIEIVLIKEGHHKLDSNSILSQNESTLLKEYRILKDLIESRANFKLKSDWSEINESPNNGIFLEYSMDSTDGFYAINTTQGHIAIYGSSNDAIRDGISMFKSLFIEEFKKNEKRNEWYIPRIIIEKKE